MLNNKLLFFALAFWQLVVFPNSMFTCTVDSSGLASTARTHSCWGFQPENYGNFVRTNNYNVNFSDGAYNLHSVYASGACPYEGLAHYYILCEPTFYPPTYTNGPGWAGFVVSFDDKSANFVSGTGWQCQTGPNWINTLTHNCSEGGGCEYAPYLCGGGYQWSWELCDCVWGNSPVLVDVSGNGFALTDADHGVGFDMDGDQSPENISRTSPGSDDAWLALDRNGNGSVDNGTELFGNFTAQSEPPPRTDRNGFLALAEFDRIENGGNADGFISSDDAVFASLRLWQDLNHNGISEPSELFSLSSKGLVNIDLDYRRSKRTDEHENQFRYRAKVRDVNGNQIGRWGWDVFLTSQTQTASALNILTGDRFASDLSIFSSRKSRCRKV